ncbi:uncharacterized protein LOC108324825 [Vigna angularis]|uniref:uncharacterized protein LOC108324825 n=1 Tax=Phaseolus angularis TaxID=3914 RepID=UPI000809B970|nr:uncharacterized protein LOC108324825 [Vigna angularis]
MTQNLTYLELTNIKQEKGDSLRNFMDRYNKTARQVRGVGKKFIISTLAMALGPSSFADKLFVKPPMTLDELQERTANFIRIEEMGVVQKRQHEHNNSTSGQEKKEGKKTFVPDECQKGQKYRDGPKGPKFERYTPLNAPRARILEEALSVDLLPPLRPFLSSKKADGTKHCTYHLNIGHITEDCTVLRDKVEELIRAGHLRRFGKDERVGRSLPKRGRTKRTDKRDNRRPDHKQSRSRSHDQPLRGVINTISKGEESDEGVIREVVVKEEEEVLLEGEQLVVGGGKIDEKDEGGERGRGRGGGERRRVLDGAVGPRANEFDPRH